MSKTVLNNFDLSSSDSENILSNSALQGYKKKQFFSEIQDQEDSTPDHNEYDDLLDDFINKLENNNEEMLFFKSKKVKESIGFKMMEKMGFNIDNVNVKTKKTINIDVKKDRKGIGSKKNNFITDETLDESNKKYYEEKKLKHCESELVKLMKLCFELSGDADVFFNDFDLDKVNDLWKEYVIDYVKTQKIIIKKPQHKNILEIDSKYKDNENSSESFKKKLMEKKKKLKNYLMENHYYCWSCGCKFENKIDFSKNCECEISQNEEI